MSRYHLVMAALRRTARADVPAALLIAECRSALETATAYAHAHFEDPPEIRDWIWTD
jgi:xylulose-5-phosphate/fructose-6-phosphate phosphoketolase